MFLYEMDRRKEESLFDFFLTRLFSAAFLSHSVRILAIF